MKSWIRRVFRAPRARGAPSSVLLGAALALSCGLALVEPGCAAGATRPLGESGAGGAGGSGTGGAGGGTPDPFGGQTVCSSGKSWPASSDEGDPRMNPGMACIQCHASHAEGGDGDHEDDDDAPLFDIAGTVYPTGHEPDRCDGVDGASAGAIVEIRGADGALFQLEVNEAGNFMRTGKPVSRPYRARVISAAGERAMGAAQTSGDCNGCHTEQGANGAPGRIVAP
jgi:hypothetical protein